MLNTFLINIIIISPDYNITYIIIVMNLGIGQVEERDV